MRIACRWTTKPTKLRSQFAQALRYKSCIQHEQYYSIQNFTSFELFQCFKDNNASHSQGKAFTAVTTTTRQRNGLN